MANRQATQPDAATGGTDAATSTYVESPADRRYSEVLDALQERLGEEGRPLLVELDELVGDRLNEAQEHALDHLLIGFADPANRGVQYWRQTRPTSFDPVLEDRAFQLWAGRTVKDSDLVAEHAAMRDAEAEDYARRAYGDRTAQAPAEQAGRTGVESRLDRLETIVASFGAAALAGLDLVRAEQIGSAAPSDALERCGCTFAGAPWHDVMLGLEDDFAAVVAATAAIECANEEDPEGCQVPWFVSEHNHWRDPVAVTKFAETISWASSRHSEAQQAACAS